MPILKIKLPAGITLEDLEVDFQDDETVAPDVQPAAPAAPETEAAPTPATEAPAAPEAAQQ